MQKMSKSFTITKRIAKHGDQSIIVIPSILTEYLSPKTLVKVTIDILTGGEKWELIKLAQKF